MHPNPNKFLTFCFSLIPGAGHMYLGLMKRGTSFMVIFMGDIVLTALASWLLGNIVAAAFGLLLPILWFVAFFDLWRYPRMGEEEKAALEDGYLLPGNFSFELPKDSTLRKARVALGIVLILAGLERLYNSFVHNFLMQFLHSPNARNFFYQVPTLVGAVAIITVGLLLIFWKSRQIKRETKEVSFDEE